MTTKGEAISRIRRLIKGTTVDSFLTDRYIYSLVLEKAKLFIKRKDDSLKLSKYNSLFQKLPGVELEEISKIEAQCISIDSCCTFYRTKEDLPPIHEGSMGYIIRRISSIDGSVRVYQTDPQTYVNMTKTTSFKYNKNRYFWIMDNKAVFPNLNWPVVDIEAMWAVDIAEFRCDASDCCVDRKSEMSNIPDDLFPEISAMVRQEMMGTIQIPQDNLLDNKNLLK